MKNIEDYLRDNRGTDGEFRLKIMEYSDDHVIIYINPVNRDGESFDGYVLFDTVNPKSFMDKMFEEIWQNVQAKLQKHLTNNGGNE